MSDQAQEADPGSRLSHYASAAELVRSMTYANRVDSTHMRTVLVQLDDEPGLLEALLDRSLLCGLVELDITNEASTVEAFACQLLGTSFHGLTFSLRPSSSRAFPSTPVLERVEPGKLPKNIKASIPPVVTRATAATFDSSRRSTGTFDGSTAEEFLIQLPEDPDVRNAYQDARCFRQLAVKVTALAHAIGRPLSFIHAPTALPAELEMPRSVTGPCLRLGVAFPELDGGLRMHFGTRLVELCSDGENDYGLWVRARSVGERKHDYWQPVVTAGAGPDRDTSSARPSESDKALAITCVGPARPGSTEAILRILERADAPLLGLSATTLDDIAIIHVLTQTASSERSLSSVQAFQPDEPADIVINAAVHHGGPLRSDILRDYRAVVSSHRQKPPDPDLAAIWLAWTVPATPDALRLTVETVRAALRGTADRYGSDAAALRRDHLNIEYLICREVAADRLRGRMRVAVDLEALGMLAPLVPGRSHGPRYAGFLPARLGQFCGDLQRQWQRSLSFALGTTQVELDVVWREGWLTRWSGLEAGTPDDED